MYIMLLINLVCLGKDTNNNLLTKLLTSYKHMLITYLNLLLKLIKIK
jgi:hypothetical protein